MSVDPHGFEEGGVDNPVMQHKDAAPTTTRNSPAHLFKNRTLRI